MRTASEAQAVEAVPHGSHGSPGDGTALFNQWMTDIYGKLWKLWKTTYFFSTNMDNFGNIRLMNENCKFTFIQWFHEKTTHLLMKFGTFFCGKSTLHRFWCVMALHMKFLFEWQIICSFPLLSTSSAGKPDACELWIVFSAWESQER